MMFPASACSQLNREEGIQGHMHSFGAFAPFSGIGRALLLDMNVRTAPAMPTNDLSIPLVLTDPDDRTDHSSSLHHHNRTQRADRWFPFFSSDSQ